jgi:hypothetical protein
LHIQPDSLYHLFIPLLFQGVRLKSPADPVNQTGEQKKADRASAGADASLIARKAQSA